MPTLIDAERVLARLRDELSHPQMTEREKICRVHACRIIREEMERQVNADSASQPSDTLLKRTLMAECDELEEAGDERD